jgi:hypothetical protein
MAPAFINRSRSVLKVETLSRQQTDNLLSTVTVVARINSQQSKECHRSIMIWDKQNRLGQLMLTFVTSSVLWACLFSCSTDIRHGALAFSANNGLVHPGRRTIRSVHSGTPRILNQDVLLPERAVFGAGDGECPRRAASVGGGATRRLDIVSMSASQSSQSSNDSELQSASNKLSKERRLLLQNFQTSWGEVVDPYTILKVKRKAETKDIKKAYYTLMKKYHPDRVANKNGILPGSW